MFESLVGNILILGIGIFLFIKGFDALKKKRLIEDIPTSTVRGLAMGMVELIGKAKKKAILHSPIMNWDCVFFQYKIERYEKHGKSSHWRTIMQGNSGLMPFYLEDATGKVLVLPQGAQTILPEDFKYETHSFSDIPKNLESFMSKNAISYKSIFGFKHRLRFREWIIQENDPVYVLGCAKKSTHFQKELEKQTKEILAKLDKDPALKSKLDFNKDGHISQEELQLAEKKINKALLKKAMKASQTGDVFDVIIGKGKESKVFIISNHSQKSLVKKLHLTCVAQIIGGILLATLGFGLLISNLRIFELFDKM